MLLGGAEIRYRSRHEGDHSHRFSLRGRSSLTIHIGCTVNHLSSDGSTNIRHQLENHLKKADMSYNEAGRVHTAPHRSGMRNHDYVRGMCRLGDACMSEKWASSAFKGLQRRVPKARFSDSIRSASASALKIICSQRQLARAITTLFLSSHASR